MCTGIPFHHTPHTDTTQPTELNTVLVRYLVPCGAVVLAIAIIGIIMIVAISIVCCGQFCLCCCMKSMPQQQLESGMNNYFNYKNTWYCCVRKSQSSCNQNADQTLPVQDTADPAAPPPDAQCGPACPTEQPTEEPPPTMPVKKTPKELFLEIKEIYTSQYKNRTEQEPLPCSHESDNNAINEIDSTHVYDEVNQAENEKRAEAAEETGF